MLSGVNAIHGLSPDVKKTNRIYTLLILGGYRSDSLRGADSATQAVWKYNVKWHLNSFLRFPRSSHRSVIVNGQLIHVGGRVENYIALYIS